MYVCINFRLEELVPRAMFEEYGQKLWMAFDARFLVTLDRLRMRYGPMYLNNWLWGGNKDMRGLRPMGSGVGAGLSQHIFGRAGDPVFKLVTAEKVREDMRREGCMGSPRKSVPFTFEYITRIEKGVGWFHFDVGNHDAEHSGVLEFTA